MYITNICKKFFAGLNENNFPRHPQLRQTYAEYLNFFNILSKIFRDLLLRRVAISLQAGHLFN